MFEVKPSLAPSTWFAELSRWRVNSFPRYGGWGNRSLEGRLKVVVRSEFRVARKEPLGQLLRRVLGAFDCRGGGGGLTLRKRTSNHHVVDLVLDVGTWSGSLTAIYKVLGPTFLVTVPLPVTKGTTVALQYPIGDQQNWEHMVGNPAAIVAELDATMLPEVEAAVGPRRSGSIHPGDGRASR